MKNNFISALLYILLIIIYSCIIKEGAVIFMYLCWMAGYSKNIWNSYEKNK